MKILIGSIWGKLKKMFGGGKKKVGSESIHFVEHIHDETVTWPNAALMWCNVHGFNESSEKKYWLGMDFRSFGIRCADYVLKFNDKSLYDEYLNAALNDTEEVLYKMRDDSRLNYTNGGDMDVDFIFKWEGDDKHFHVHLSGDSYAEQK